MNGGYIILDATGIDTSSFEAPVKIPGAFSLAKAAITMQKPLLITGLKNGEYFVSPQYVVATDGGTEITLKGFEAKISSDDQISPSEAV